MIDLHTHILPDWDDGAKDQTEAIKMCHLAHRDGIRALVSTPHLYRMTKHGDSMEVLKVRMAVLAELRGRLPVEVYPGAEVFVHPEMVENIKKHGLTINRSNYVFVEFPAEFIIPGVKDLFFKLMLAGLIPVISHPERNAVFAERPSLLYDLIKMGSFAQVTAMSIVGEFGPQTKKTAEVFLKHNLVQLIASDAHDADRRPPRLSDGVREAAKLVGKEKAQAMVTEVPRAILENRAVADYGEPENPERRRKWVIKMPRFLKGGPSSD
ncbi:MAG: CpsB/CapC family capsule biosynthesis tyrosine phosphatase [Acidobacteriota bacterium]